MKIVITVDVQEDDDVVPAPGFDHVVVIKPPRVPQDVHKQADPRPKAPLSAKTMQQWDDYLKDLRAWSLRNPGMDT